MTSCCSHHRGLHKTTYMLKLVTLSKPYLFRLMSFQRHTRELWCGFRCAACFKQLVCYSNTIILYLPVSCRKTWRPTSKYAKVACTEITEELAMNACVEVSALSGDWNRSAEGRTIMRLIRDKKNWIIENYLMCTLRETGMAFQMREISFTFMLPCIVIISFYITNQTH